MASSVALHIDEQWRKRWAGIQGCHLWKKLVRKT